MIDQKQPKNVEYFNYVDSIITNDARCTRGIKSKIALAKAALFHQQIGITVFFLLGYSPASEFYVPTFRNTLFHLHRWCKQEEIKRNWN
jgi:hypothetical protein